MKRYAVLAVVLAGCAGPTGGPTPTEVAVADVSRRANAAALTAPDCADAYHPGRPVTLPDGAWCLDLGTPTVLARLTVPCPDGGPLHTNEYASWRPGRPAHPGYPLAGLTASWVAAACQ